MIITNVKLNDQLFCEGGAKLQTYFCTHGDDKYSENMKNCGIRFEIEFQKDEIGASHGTCDVQWNIFKTIFSNLN